MTSRAEILQWLEETFRVSVSPDVSYNGLQFEGTGRIGRIVTGVDATLPFFTAAVAAKADLAIVHHGLFWKNREWRRIDRFARRLVEVLAAGDLNLYALHLPLDSHPEMGNNAQLAIRLGAKVDEPFGEFLGQKIGLRCHFPRPLTVAAFRDRVEKVIGPVLGHLPFGGTKIRTIGIVSGGGWDSVGDPAVAEGKIDALLTGEVIHQAVAPCQERGVHLFAAGHYATERFGVQALGEGLAKRFGLRHAFLDLPTGL